MKYIFITGGVISGVGKGVTTASIGAILKEMGYKIGIKKLDPYLNVDPGTMNPVEHGEVYVAEDGAETDLDLGYYERFTGITVGKNNSISSGKLLDNLIKRERKGDYLGKTVQINPHFTNMIKDFFMAHVPGNPDIILCEIGGSAGDIEAAPFFEAIRQFQQEKGKKNVIICTVVFMVYYAPSKEIKTKPAQVALRQYLEKGIIPNIVFARSDHPLSTSILAKVGKGIGIPESNIIPALNVPTIYQVPVDYYNEGIVQIFNILGIKSKHKPNMEKWIKLNKKISNLKYSVMIAMVGKYVELEDSYYSVLESLNHAGWHLDTKVIIKWVNARVGKVQELYKELSKVDGILVPGGFGTSGIEEILKCITYARINKIPYMGICYGMQLATIEFARNVLGIKDASSSEFGKKGDTFIVDIMSGWVDDTGKRIQRSKESDIGGTLRLGSYPASLKKGSLIYKLYGKEHVSERHRHRYEVDMTYKDDFEKKGMLFTGLSPDQQLPEMIELDRRLHPFFIGMQGHPEFKSTPFIPRPFFVGLIEAALNYQRSRKNTSKRIPKKRSSSKKVVYRQKSRSRSRKYLVT